MNTAVDLPHGKKFAELHRWARVVQLVKMPEGAKVFAEYLVWHVAEPMTGVCICDFDTLAKGLHKSPDTVKRRVKILEKFGFLECRRGKWRGLCSEFIFKFPGQQ